MTRRFLLLALGLCALPLAAFAGDPGFNGRWRLEAAQSSRLDGWTGMDLVIAADGPKVSLRYDMSWRQTKAGAVNVVDTWHPVSIANFFRIDQRHMAVYAQSAQPARVRAEWIDGGRTLRVEAEVTVEVSQGNRVMRLYDEFRLLEGGGELELIELHSTRNRPLVYFFARVPNTPPATP
jgi:hypothetical protein